MLAGLRSPADAAALLRALSVPALTPLAADLEAATTPQAATTSQAATTLRTATSPQALADALAAILTWPAPPELIAAVTAACATLASSAGPYAAACAAAVREAARHPDDLGVVAMLLLQHVELSPGQAVFMPAGGLHAYLQGTGIEVLANSDNVIRAGLTAKHIDVPELLKLLDPTVAVPILTPTPLTPAVAYFNTPAPEFRLYLADLPPAPEVPLPAAGPRIALCTHGAATLRTESGASLALTRGQSCFIPACDGPAHATGPARLFLSAVQ